MVEARLLDSAGRRRSPASMPGYHLGRIPSNKGQRYPADPPRTEEIVAVMGHAGENLHGDRVRALIVILWRAGLRIQEALSLTELYLDPRRGPARRPGTARLPRPDTIRAWVRQAAASSGGHRPRADHSTAPNTRRPWPRLCWFRAGAGVYMARFRALLWTTNGSATATRRMAPGASA